MKDILKNWKTSLIGIMIIIGLGIHIYHNGMNIQDAIFGLLSIGFLFAKDADKSHTQSISGDHPNPDKEEK